MNEYQEEAHIILNRAKTYLTDPKKVHISTNKNGTILSKKDLDTSPISCYMLETVLKKPASVLASHIWDVDENIVKKYDHDITYWTEIEKSQKGEKGDAWKVCHQTTSAPWPIWPRELAFAQVKIQDDKDNTIWLVAFSISHEKVPLRDKEFVRAVILMSIWGFTPMNENENETKVTRVVHVEPRGSIPTWAVNAAVNKHVGIVENLALRT